MRQETFMMLKPDAFASHNENKVIEDLKGHGLIIEKHKVIEVDMHIMKILLEHYEEVINSMPKDFNFPGKMFNSFYYEGPHYIMPMKVAYEGDEDIITYTRAFAGKTNPMDADPASLRGKYSHDCYDQAGKERRLVNNVIHASDSKENAQRELKIWEDILY